MVVFKKRDSVPSARYSSVCNVLCLKSMIVYLARDIPAFVMYCVNGVYRLYDIDYNLHTPLRSACEPGLTCTPSALVMY